jgi:hypothetical protein
MTESSKAVYLHLLSLRLDLQVVLGHVHTVTISLDRLRAPNQNEASRLPFTDP